MSNDPTNPPPPPVFPSFSFGAVLTAPAVPTTPSDPLAGFTPEAARVLEAVVGRQPLADIPTASPPVAFGFGPVPNGPVGVDIETPSPPSAPAPDPSDRVLNPAFDPELVKRALSPEGTPDSMLPFRADPPYGGAATLEYTAALLASGQPPPWKVDASDPAVPTLSPAMVTALTEANERMDAAARSAAQDYAALVSAADAAAADVAATAVDPATPPLTAKQAKAAEAAAKKLAKEAARAQKFAAKDAAKAAREAKQQEARDAKAAKAAEKKAKAEARAAKAQQRYMEKLVRAAGAFAAPDHDNLSYRVVWVEANRVWATNGHAALILEVDAPAAQRGAYALRETTKASRGGKEKIVNQWTLLPSASAPPTVDVDRAIPLFSMLSEWGLVDVPELLALRAVLAPAPESTLLIRREVPPTLTVYSREDRAAPVGLQATGRWARATGGSFTLRLAYLANAVRALGLEDEPTIRVLGSDSTSPFVVKSNAGFVVIMPVRDEEVLREEREAKAKAKEKAAPAPEATSEAASSAKPEAKAPRTRKAKAPK